MELLEIPNKHAECYENKHEEKDHVPGLRVFRISPDAVTLQIVTHAGIGDYGKGKKRNMLAHLSLDRGALVLLRDVINAELRKLPK